MAEKGQSRRFCDVHIISGLRVTSEMPICWRRAGRDNPSVADAIIERRVADWSSSALTPRLISAKLAFASRDGREPSPTDPARARWRCESRMRPLGKLSGRVLHDGGANDDQSEISTRLDRVRGARDEEHARFAERLLSMASLSSNWRGLDGAGCPISMPTRAAGSAAFTISRVEAMSRSG